MSSNNQFIPRPSKYGSSQPDINILMMGETGVGKSTLINAFANYLVYNTLKKAAKGEMQVLIPSAFYMTDPKTYEEKKISIGNPSDDEKCEEVGQSSTQVCRSYIFPIGNRILRLIDAPGIGDVRGMDKDKENCDHILSYINHYEHLNGICILFKANSNTLSPSFRFCFKEILTHLHINAKDNLMFIFTNGRSTFYRPDSTTPLIRILLQELNQTWNIEVPFNIENTFIFDNEPFRFLAACKNRLTFSSREETDYSNSWEKSVEEFSRLIERILRCNTHAVRDSLSINAAQQLIRNLIRPIGEIARLIQENIRLAKEYKQTFSGNLSSVLPNPIPQKTGKFVAFDYPRTVCVSGGCTQIIKVDNELKVDYVTKCHPHCYLRPVERECVGHSILKHCRAINKHAGLCEECGCHWKEHMHITYEYQTYVTSFEIDASSSDSPLIRIDQHITALRQEEAFILQICSKLSKYIKQNSIAPYNDDIVEYIRYFIREEEMKRSAGANNKDVIQGLQKMIEEYEQEQKLFNTTTNIASNFTNDECEPRVIFSLVGQLYQLPINGPNIQEQIEGLKVKQLQINENKEYFVQIPSNANSSKVMERLKNLLN